MEIIKEPRSHYLHHSHYSWGLKVAFLWPLFCYLVSSYFWTQGSLRVTKDLVFQIEGIWRLILGVFAHGDLNHFLSNSLFLSILSFFIARAYGLKVLVFLGLFMGVATHGLTLMFMKPGISLLGASGLVYAFWGFWFVLYFFIDRFIPIHRRLMKISAISILLLIPQQFDPQVSYLAHGIGFFMGVLSGGVYFFLNKKRIRSFEKFNYILDPSPYLTNDEYEDEYWKIENQ